MSKKVIRLITLILAIAMVACLAVGCGEDADVNSDNPSSKPTQSANEKAPGMLPGVDPEDYRGKTVKFATWKDPWKNEDGVVIDEFMKKTGIKVEWVPMVQYTYVNTIVASIAAGQQPDVFFENGDFPGSLNAMQPLDAAKFDLTDPIWNQATIKASTLDGHAYLVNTISNIWTEVDICVYNKKLFDDNGIKSPAEYYEEGDWTFANFRQAAMEISDIGKDYVGAGILSEPALGAAGCSFFTYKDNKMTVTVDERLYDVMNFLSEMRTSGYLILTREGFDNGKTGMTLTNCFGLKKTGYFSTINPDHVAATYLPVWEKGDPQYTTGIYRGWGLVDGAKEPVAAGLFLRYYLDVNNYDPGAGYLNQDVANFFFQVTGTYSEDMIYYHGPDMVKTTGFGTFIHDSWKYKSPANMKGYIDGQLNVLQEMCDKANEIIANERKQIKQYEDEGKINKLSK